MPVRVILADDHPIVAAGVRQLLEHDSTTSVVHVASSTDELMGKLASTPCDLLITDFSMPGNTAPIDVPSFGATALMYCAASPLLAPGMFLTTIVGLPGMWRAMWREIVRV